MSGNLRAPSKLWDAATVGGNDSSAAGNIGPMSNVALFIKTDTNVTLSLQCSASLAVSSGRNAAPKTDGSEEARWFPYAQAAVSELDSGNPIGSNADKIVLSAGDHVCIDLSPFSPTFIRLLRTDGGANAVITAFTVAVG